MRAIEALRVLKSPMSDQWGMVTTAQAERLGVSRLDLSRLTHAGQLERLAHGVYRDAAVPADRFDFLRTAWLSLVPKRTAPERLSSETADAVVSGSAAAWVHGIGDLVPEPYEFTVPARRQTQRHELSFRVRTLPPSSVTIRAGLPVTSVEQTTADLAEVGHDRTLVAQALADAATLDRGELVRLLAPLAARNGFPRGDGEEFCAELERLAHRDEESLAKALAATPLGARVSAEYVNRLLQSTGFRALAASEPALLRAIQAAASPSTDADTRD